MHVCTAILLEDLGSRRPSAGAECDVTIFSPVKPAKGRKYMDKRINVALSRARHWSYVVVSSFAFCRLFISGDKCVDLSAAPCR
jgi:hypothetical protein